MTSPWFRKLFGPARPRKAQRPRYVRPELEPLEKRITPQATRTWVSGYVGDDTGPDSRTAPGLTFAMTETKTAAGGIIQVLDPGDFGPVIINKSLTIDGTGTFGGITATSGNAITINAGPTDVVILRDLKLQGDGQGIAGVQILSAGEVYIENCDIENFSGAGIDFEPTNAGAKLFVSNTTLLDNAGGGALLKPNGVAASASLDHVDAMGNQFGVRANDNVVATVSNSDASGNVQNGFQTVAVANNAQMNLQSDVASNNGMNGVTSEGLNSLVTISGLTATGNSGQGTLTVSNGALFSSGTNVILDNGKGFTPPSPPTAPGTGAASRTWVSGTGDDSNPASRTAPDKTFAGAFSRTNAGGEIDALDPGGFGAVTITKSITIDGSGTLASILATTGSNGIVINAASTDVVILRGLKLQGIGQGLNGIKIVSAGAVYIVDCDIENFTQAGIDFVPTNPGAQLFVIDSQLLDNVGGGVLVQPGASARAVIDGVQADGNGFGVEAADNADVTVSNSSAGGNTAAGFQAVSASAAAVLNLQNDVASNNGTNGALSSGANAVVNFADLTATGNSGPGTLATGGALNAIGSGNVITDNGKGFTPPLPPTAPGTGAASRTWVSGTGDDANPASRTAPAKTFAGAISRTNAGGEIDVLDPGGFGAVTITKSITIDGSGSFGGILVSTGSNGIVINAASTDVVILRGLKLQGNGLGVNGIQINSAGAVYIVDCDIENFTQAGIDFVPTNARAQLFVIDSQLLDNVGGGVLVQPGGVAARAVIDGVQADGNGFGIEAADNADVTVSNSSAGGNTAAGFQAVSASAAAVLNLRYDVASNNGTSGALSSGANAVVNFADLTATGNSGPGALATGGALNGIGSGNVIADNSKGFTPPLPPTAPGAASRTWVSGTGDDANPASRTAPDKTFAGAISRTNAGGEIDVLDPGGFGPVTITKSITIDGSGSFGGILVSGTNGIVINAASTDVVILRGLTLDGDTQTALAGIKIVSAGAVYIEDCDIENFGGAGIDFEPTNAGAQLFVENSLVDNNAGGGVLVKPNGVAARAVIDGVEADGNSFGVEAADNADATVSNGNGNGNTSNGFAVVASGSSSVLNLEGAVAALNGQHGVYAQGPINGSGAISATANLANVNAIGNMGTALLANGASPLDSFINQLLNVDVGGTLAITSIAATGFTVGIQNSFTVTTSTNGATPTLMEIGGLPSAVSFTDNHNGTAQISGIPAMGSNPTYTITIIAHNGQAPNVTQTFTLTVNTLSVSATSVVSDAATGVNEFILFANGTVYRHTAGNATLAPVASNKVDAISAGLDAAGKAEVTVQYDSDKSLWSDTSTGWVQLTGGSNDDARLAGRTIKMFAAGMNGIVDVVFTDTTFWRLNTAAPGSALQAANKAGVAKTGINFVAVGVHNGAQADFVSFLDNSPTSNGGVWEYIGPGQAWTPVTSLDVYAISASWDLSDTADLIVSNANYSGGNINAGITDHSAYAWRGTPNMITVICSQAVSSLSVNALGNDFYVLQSTGSLYEHRKNDPITTTTALVTGSSTPVTAVFAPNANTDVVDYLFANGTLWQISGLTSIESGSPNLHYNPLAS